MARASIDFNALGDRAESLTEFLLTEFGGKSKPLFRPCFLGDKWRTLDFYVELVGNSKWRPFFFLQVKTTTKDKDAKRRRLPVKVSAADMKRLVAIPAPTYVVGLDMKAKQGYLHAAYQPGGITFVSSSRPLTYANLERLRTEVLDYWRENAAKPSSSYFEVQS